MLKIIENLLNGDAVQFLPLGEVLIRTKGTKITATKMREINKENAPIKIFAGGKTTAYFDYDDLPAKDINTEPSIIVKSRGVIEFEYYDKPFSHKSEMWAYHSKNENVNIKFVYYYLKMNEPYFQKLASKMQMPQIATPDTDKYIIPIPPMRVQEEIIRILDMFSELTAELTAELSLRQKQYEYYREKLLTFTNDTAQFLPLGEVCKLITDFTAAGSFASNAANVKYLQDIDYALLVRTTDLKSLFKNSNIFVYVDEHAFNYLWRVNLNQESVIMPNVGNCGEIYYLTPNMIPHKNAVLGPNSILLRTAPNILNKFLYYILQTNSFQSDLSKITSKAGQPKFNKTNLKAIKIPIPPIEEQERIVAILDKFDSLVNSISDGLPAEINLRQKQYEYYRNALLSFE